MGCNKMTCLTCHSKFCYLCGDILPPENPYTHYALDDPEASKSCRGLLFHGVDENGQLRDAEGRVDAFWWRRRQWDWEAEEEEEGEGQREQEVGQEEEEEEEEDERVFGVGMLLGI